MGNPIAGEAGTINKWRVRSGFIPNVLGFKARSQLAPELKLELLEEPRERVRLVRLCEILEALAAAVERQREIAELASRNGRVKTCDG